MIIDGHLHLAGSPEPILTRMDALGIDRVVLVGVGVRDLSVVTVRDSLVFHLPWLLHRVGPWRARAVVRSRRLREALMPQPDNDSVASALRAHPDRFWGFVFVNPTDPGAAAMVERRLADGFRGIKLALLQYPADLNGPEVSALCEIAQARRVPIFFHQGLTAASADPTGMVRRYPAVRFIIAHAGVQYFEQAIALARGQRNVWLDTSSYFVTPAKLRRLVRELGAHKLVFGSDYPVMALDPGAALKKIMALALPEQDRAAILGGNLRAILETEET
jgi:predicted TIM-barrel fold metal-dependent hydrolase